MEAADAPLAASTALSFSRPADNGPASLGSLIEGQLDRLLPIYAPDAATAQTVRRLFWLLTAESLDRLAAPPFGGLSFINANGLPFQWVQLGLAGSGIRVPVRGWASRRIPCGAVGANPGPDRGGMPSAPWGAPHLPAGNRRHHAARGRRALAAALAQPRLGRRRGARPVATPQALFQSEPRHLPMSLP